MTQRNLPHCCFVQQARMYVQTCHAITAALPCKHCDPACLPQDGVELPAESESRQRIHIMPSSCLTLTPLPPEAPGSGQRTRADVVAFVDANMPSVPEPIIQFVLRVRHPASQRAYVLHTSKYHHQFMHLQMHQCASDRYTYQYSRALHG